ncbi:PREDICTED: F-box only protein 28 [Papilio xuthus]|uniref:F-box only protein 28 n=1 Tax=Papilio xuthus TaxID=66420 RepID=A0AAJ6ZFK9_PAPXU|nr:PREDICTED: F-box only protein 28 [Papilio xuthus]XP_013171548.1 PREDICTED: F-box only protein 28 [Papilio xuthus]XP_013171558.1 PREDICTED: F-box only protein 28 [Papilio xuthus]XP_013171566.1 PREDICTED: F-box only protein 28 [Papilio xuthus]XP_013171575.1 PREDICTED: F-box only protein 28 [Papilio xuthus]
MVSTRQMSSIGSSNGGGDGSGPSHAEPVTVARVTRHSSALLPGGSSPHAGSSKNTLAPPPKVFTTNFLDMPTEVVEKIFRILGFKAVAQLRLVNRQFNTICSGLLNSTFQRLQNQMLHRFQSIKAKMPRRESARRSHPLACESDIIETLHMRLSLLQMTFGKHIERKHCCFFPGEILDEVYGILSYLKTATKLARPYKVTDELFDLTTMAMEYFKEHIEPNLPEITYFGTDFFDITNAFSPGESSKSYLCLDSPPPSGFESRSAAPGGSSAGDRDTSVMNPYLEESLPPSPPPPQSNMVLRKRIHRIKQGMKKYNDQLSALRTDLRSCKRKTALQQKQIAEQQKQIAEQQKQTLEYANRLDDYDKKNEETSRKFQTLLQELNKCKTELQYWRSRSPAVPPLCAECGASLRLSPAALDQWAAAETETNETATAGGSKDAAVTPAVTEPEPVTEIPLKNEHKSEASSGEESTNTPPTRRRASADATATPDRKKRRLTRPRKL